MNWRLRRILELARGLFRRTPRLTDDEQWKAWQAMIRRARSEIISSFHSRHNFREIQDIFAANPMLQTNGAHVYEWMFTMYGHSQVIAVRREVDRDSRAANIAQLLVQIMNRPEVVSKARYRAHFKPESVFTVQMQDEQFAALAGQGEHIDPAMVKADRNRLWNKAEKCVRYANNVVAHRGSLELTLTLKEIDEAMAVIEEMFQKYYLLLTGSSLTQAEPHIQYNWREPFTYPWIVRP